MTKRSVRQPSLSQPRKTRFSSSSVQPNVQRARHTTNERRGSGDDSRLSGIRRHTPDYGLLVAVCALLMCGAVVVYAIGPGLTIGNSLPDNYFSTKQITAILLGIVTFAVAGSLPVALWRRLQTPIIASAAVIALAVRFVGESINGAHRWIEVGGFSFQAAELIKLALVLGLAYFLAEKSRARLMHTPQTLYQIGALVIAVLFVVAGLQSDLGSAAVMVAMIGMMSFAAGLPMKRLGAMFVVAVVLVGLAIGTSEYRRDRVATFLNPQADCQDEGYQACQALITIGSGGLTGKGLGRSVQAYGYLPEPANDSIFAIVAEKFGFVGSVTMVGVFWLLFRKIYSIARRSVDMYTQLLVFGILVWLSVQMMINVAAMLGLIPLKGITLPFVSYGGTSIIFVMVAMGIVFAASRYTDLSAVGVGAGAGGANSKRTHTQALRRRR